MSGLDDAHAPGSGLAALLDRDQPLDGKVGEDVIHRLRHSARGLPGPDDDDASGLVEIDRPPSHAEVRAGTHEGLPGEMVRVPSGDRGVENPPRRAAKTG